MFIVRLFAVALLILATIAGGSEIVEWVRTGTRFSLTAGQLWYAFHAESLTAIQAFIQRDLHPALWDPVMVWILKQPAWLSTGVPGFLLLWCDIWMNLSQPRNPRRRPRFRTTG